MAYLTAFDLDFGIKLSIENQRRPLVVMWGEGKGHGI